MLYWTLSLGRKGPIKLGPSVRKFLRIGSFVFSETEHGVRGPYIVMSDRAGFFGKNPHRAKMTKNGQKWPKNMVFGLFKKITSLVLSGICVKRKFLWFINILGMLGKNHINSYLAEIKENWSKIKESWKVKIGPQNDP